MVCVAILLLTTAFAVGDVFSKKDYKELQTRGEEIAELQNIYTGDTYDTRTVTRISNLLKQYISDGTGCELWYSGLTWEFVTETVTDTDSQDVLWLGYNVEHELSAYVSGIYVQQTKMFKDLVRHEVVSEWEGLE